TGDRGDAQTHGERRTCDQTPLAKTDLLLIHDDSSSTRSFRAPGRRDRLSHSVAGNLDRGPALASSDVPARARGLSWTALVTCSNSLSSRYRSEAHARGR